MTASERNDQIEQTITKLLSIHKEFTGAKILTDKDWEIYINSMDIIVNEHRGASAWIPIRKVSQALLDDTENTQTLLREHHKQREGA